MPGKTKKDVYVAKTMADLNKLAEVSQKSVGSNPRLLVKTAPKLLKQAEECDLLGDEEKAYILYMRFFNTVMIMKKTPDYRKDKDYYDSLVGQKNLLKAMDKAEELSKSLKDRYDFLEAKAVSEKLAQVDSVKEESDDVLDLEDDKPDSSGKSAKDISTTTVAAKAPSQGDNMETTTQTTVNPIQLYSLLTNKELECVIMDVRKQIEYNESHIKHPSCISIPEESLPPGTTVTHIEKSIPEASKLLWKRRQALDVIVLLDWDSTLEKVTIGTALRTLKDALYKYDSTVILKKEPVVLEGGYDQWLSHYPMMSTNPKVAPPTSKTVHISSAPDLDFDYPDDIDEEYFGKPKPQVVQKPPLMDQSDLSKHLTQFSGMDQSESLREIPSVNGDTMPRIDRSTKPKPGVSQINKKDFTSFSVDGINSGNLYPSVTTKPVNKPEHTDHRATAITSTDSGTSLETKSSVALSEYSEELKREKEELEEIRKQKAKELDSFQKEKDRMSKERQARIEKLKQEEKNLQLMEQKKQDQSRDLAELMRKKRNLQEEIQQETKEEEEQKLTRFEEENARKRELMRMQQDEAERKKRLEDVERLRMERKKKEEEIRKTQEEEEALVQARERAKKVEDQKRLELKLAAEQAEKVRQEQARQKEKEAREKAQRELEEKEAQAKLQQQKDSQARQQEEEKRREMDRQRQEREKKEKEERDRVEKERMTQALKLAEDKMRRINDKPQVRTIPSPNLPVGWEKLWDKNTGRYFYVDHQNNKTQWEHPSAQLQHPVQQKDSFKTKLKDDSEPRSSGLKRSHSTPNIAQLINDEANNTIPSMPTVDRSKKPSQRVIEPKPLQMSHVRNLNPTYGNVGSALTGLRNLGNTCYMNSIIQCLNNTAPLVQYFLTDRYLFDINRESILGSHGEVADEFAVIVKALWQGQYRNITPRDFKYIVGKHQPMFAGHEQQDSQEFLTFLMDGLHEGLNKVKRRPKIPDQDNDRIPDAEAARIAWKNHCLLHDSIIVELFQGQLKSTLTCLTCGKQSTTFQAFMYLSLPIPSGSRCNIQDCLRQFLKKESMTGSSRWKCPRCRVERDSEKKIDIWKLPKILIIALNRFVYEGMWRQKINAYVDFPVNDLSLDKFIQGPPQSTHYQLFGVSNHYGTMDGGHYTAFCKNTGTKKWYKFDDHEVFEMSSSDVKTSAGFVLFYTSCNFTVPNYRQQF